MAARKPVHVIQRFPLSASIWRNQGKDYSWHAVTFQRKYKDNQGQWQYTDSFNSTDLAMLSWLCKDASDWIIHAEAEERSGGARPKADNQGQGQPINPDAEDAPY